MSNILCYEDSTIEVSLDDEILRASNIRCSPPARLKPKGTMILLHDFFRTSYQFRHVIDLLAMGGYITIAPDLPGQRVWPQQRAARSISKENIAVSMVEMLRVAGFQQPVHLVGCGFGALIASMLATQHPDLVASAALGAGSSTSDLEGIVALSGSSTKEERLQVFKQCLTSDTNTSSLSNEDIEEYVEAFSDTSVLLAMQVLSRASSLGDVPATCSSTVTAHPWTLELRLDVSPEEEPEHFALSVLSHANNMAKQRISGPHVCSLTERITCKM